jgi:hypothetical protein
MRFKTAGYLVLGAFLWVLGVADIKGHSSRGVKAEEMTVFPDRIVLRVSYRVSEPRFTADLRERFDRDADGALGAAERAALEGYVRRLALEDLRVRLDGRELVPSIVLEAASGLERAVPSAYPLDFSWKLEFRLAAGNVIELADREARWNTPFQCRVVERPGAIRVFDFPGGSGSFRIEIR